MNRFQALRTLNIKSDSSMEDVKLAYRKLALEYHPDKNISEKEGIEFKKITEAYNYLKKNTTEDNNNSKEKFTDSNNKTNFERKPQWGAPPGGKIPEEDWSRYTREFEEGDPTFWREYEKKFWEEYNARVRSDGKQGEYEKAKEPEKQPNLFVNVDKSLCIGCCSCEMIAPDVFSINRNSRSNPKSSVINPKGAGINKIMNAAETCPTKAIIVENADTKERLFPY
ncbi:DnaJ domain-containing protein [Nitrosarchaeum sp. AC2]|uniref:DnaJ domain-containing protein n=1 Tax=Nitrosarchaeum sp. AC2 TaxID=2259673 RepID=UPI0015C9CAA4|nr:DnaJ domain-containing protein [Nitrosarchaeum sp. AC2]QLH11139.1 molecular chaperone DnaJ [Nitrosarchaeum sp. AC2]